MAVHEGDIADLIHQIRHAGFVEMPTVFVGLGLSNAQKEDWYNFYSILKTHFESKG